MTVTQISPCAKNKKRVNVYLDDEFCFACYLETMHDEGLYVGRKITEEEAREIREKDGAEWAWRTAVDYASSAMKTEKQVLDKLIQKGIDEDAARGAVEKLREYRLVDDEEYAQLYAEHMYGKYGKWVVARKLREKGIAQDIIERVTAQDTNQEVLDDLTRRLMEKNAGLEPYQRTQKVMRSLQTKGFEFDDIRRAISRWEENASSEPSNEE